jgi:hypothetical protein
MSKVSALNVVALGVALTSGDVLLEANALKLTLGKWNRPGTQVAENGAEDYVRLRTVKAQDSRPAMRKFSEFAGGAFRAVTGPVRAVTEPVVKVAQLVQFQKPARPQSAPVPTQSRRQIVEARREEARDERAALDMQYAQRAKEARENERKQVAINDTFLRREEEHRQQLASEQSAAKEEYITNMFNKRQDLKKRGYNAGQLTDDLVDTFYSTGSNRSTYTQARDAISDESYKSSPRPTAQGQLPPGRGLWWGYLMPQSKRQTDLVKGYNGYVADLKKGGVNVIPGGRIYHLVAGKWVPGELVDAWGSKANYRDLAIDNYGMMCFGPV